MKIAPRSDSHNVFDIFIYIIFKSLVVVYDA